MWNLPPPPGFVGFDPDGPVRIYMRHLPHWRQEGATYFATFRLADSLPQSRLRELAALRGEWERRNGLPPMGRSTASIDLIISRSTASTYVGRSRASTDGVDDQWQALTRQLMERVEGWLDEGYGCCVLREPLAADCLEQKLRHYDGRQYDLCAFVLMPNHAHVLVKPYSDTAHPLERIEQGWKAYSSREINAARGTNGPLWQQESFDRIVRDEEHLFRCLQYIGDNPRRAGLAPHEVRRWIRADWIAAGWNFNDP
jgi:putative transposase